jgi:hypothetical protein
MVKSRDTSRQEAGMSLRSPDRLFLPAKFDGPGGASPAPTESLRVCRRESLIGGRFAPWQRAQTELESQCCCGKSRRAAQTSPCAREFARGGRLARGFEVGRGVGQGYFAGHAGGCGFDSHLAPTEAQAEKLEVSRASSSMGRAPDVHGRMFPSSSFWQRKEVPSWKK